MTRSNIRPSDLRRKALNEELSIPLVSNFFPIERYYDAADKVYESFCTALKQKSADDAYVYGKRYCLFCLDAIPTHNYYNSAKYRSTQVKHNKQVQAVIGQLETVVQWMDDEEVEKHRIARLKAERERLERERKQQERFDEFQRRVEQQKMRHGGEQAQNGGSTSSSSTAVEASALSKLDLLMRPNQSSSSSLLPPSSLPQKASQVHRIPQDPSGEEPIQGRPSSRYRLADDTDDDEEGGGDAEYRNGNALPPPIPPPMMMINGSSAPPSYTQIMAAQQHRKFLGPAPTAVAGHETPSSSSSSFVSGSRICGNDDVDNHQGPQVLQIQNDDLQSIKKLGHRIQMKKLQDYYRSQYIQFQQSGRIQVFSIPTYQGRIEESTNGCTVISALIAATHLNNSNSSSSNNNGGGNITDQQVTQVIDRTCGPILREIRRKLGLGGHALIIPSDVHDHLVDMKLLQQQYFEGAAGGNIMDAEHLGAFLKLLSVGEDGKSSHRKGAATLFFREHVISIVKIPNGMQDSSSSAYYDLIDSLPSTSNGNGGGMSATRTRCKDLQSLVVLLNWYASRKFSDSNCSYIDRNAWDDATADFDPRVFQGFVWLVK